TQLAATLVRWSASSTRDKQATSPNPARPGANSAKPTASWPACEWLLARKGAAGVATASTIAVPRNDISSTARTEPAAAWSHSAPSRTDKAGKALTEMEIASTAYAASNTCQPYW